MDGIKTTREVAAELGIQEWEIEAALRRREVARPIVVSGVRLWTPEAIGVLRTVIATRVERRIAAQRRRP
jgi:hypothetical protein